MFVSGAVHLLIASTALVLAQDRTTLDYLTDMGLRGEEHRVISPDGYILSLFRIPSPAGTPLLVLHGFLQSSDTWVVNPQRQRNLVTILAEKGYDVWLLNQRGNSYSHEHVYLSSESNNYDYWNYTTEDVSLKDLPTAMEYVLSETGEERLEYMGHSMGGTVFLLYCSAYPQECRERVQAAVLLSPVAFKPDQIPNLPMRLLVRWAPTITASLRKANIYEFFGRDQKIVNYLYTSCRDNSTLCSLILQSLDFSAKEQQEILMRPIYEYVPILLGGTSIRIYEELSLLVSSEEGRFFNSPTRIWQANSNSERKYYDLGRIRVPIAMYTPEDDVFIDQKARKELSSSLKSLVVNQLIAPPFKHMGFFYRVNKDSYKMVKSILDFLDKYDVSKKRHETFEERRIQIDS